MESFEQKYKLIAFLCLKKEEKIFKNLQKKGYIDDFIVSHSQDRKITDFHFKLQKICFETNEKTIFVDLSSYKIKIQYKKGIVPFVFCENADFSPITPHIYHNYKNALCLYKIGNIDWRQKTSFGESLFPWICTWFYFYEKWLETDIWYGEEASH